jgi:hypothetical protein
VHSDRSPEVPLIVQIGGGHLVLHSIDRPLVDRFHRLYGDCEVDRESAYGARVDCVVASSADNRDVVVDVADEEDVRLDEFMATVFTDRGCRQGASDGEGWREMESRSPDLRFRVRGRRLVFGADSPWRAMVANLAMGLVIRLQHDVIFLHASGVAFDRGRGVLFVGPKAAGKTTTALGLASRGHVFLGDEMVGVRQATLDVVPLLRTISKRDGPCAETVERALAKAASWSERYPDGETRTIIPASLLFKTRPTATRVEAIVFLDGFSERPELTPIAASLDTASRLTPVTSTLWSLSPTARVFALVKLLSSSAAFTLRLGPPDLTSSLLEERFAEPERTPCHT